MNSRTDEFKEIREIVDAICDQTADDGMLSRLKDILQGDAKAQRFYIEYMDMNSSLMNQDEDLSMTIRRLQVEEISFGKKNSSPVPPPINPSDNENLIEGPLKKSRNWFFILIFFLLIVLVFFLLQFRATNYFTFISTDGVFDSKGAMLTENDEVAIGLYKIENSCELKLAQGDYIKVVGPGELRIKANRHFYIDAKSVEVKNSEAVDSLIIEISKSKFISSKADYLIEKQVESLLVSVKKGDVDSVALNGAPIHYLPLDNVTDRTPDVLGNAQGVLFGTTKSVKGLIGNGAVRFNNSDKDVINLGNGGGKAKATGTFSVNQGVTVEILTDSDWTGEELDNDHLFRKDTSSVLPYDTYKIVLSLQNDYKDWSKFSYPDYGPGPCLAFGIYLVGHKYQELELLLDGKDGRPTLEEFKTGVQHIVGTYDSKSGFKRIYLNGKKLAEVQYVPETRIISGGPDPAAIGSNLNRNGFEGPYNGILDEFSFYDFALPAGEILQHFKNVKSGVNYYATRSPKIDLIKKRVLKIHSGQALKIDLKTGLLY
ncbi:MAG: LamG domain-containing protein [Lentisphaeraceae bacterium]|nr:LamG domain-containing protein [Lentisphaeraceae bacterium]